MRYTTFHVPLLWVLPAIWTCQSIQLTANVLPFCRANPKLTASSYLKYDQQSVWTRTNNAQRAAKPRPEEVQAQQPEVRSSHLLVIFPFKTLLTQPCSLPVYHTSRHHFNSFSLITDCAIANTLGPPWLESSGHPSWLTLAPHRTRVWCCSTNGSKCHRPPYTRWPSCWSEACSEYCASPTEYASRNGGFGG